jgi:predicted DNA-binding protein
MRTTKVIAFSVPGDFEQEIHRHAKSEHRTISEYIREAIRKYMEIREFDETRTFISKRLRKKGLGPSDVEKVISVIRKKR